MQQYQNPLIERYSSKEMSHIFSPQKKFSIWRQLWLALAELQKEQGLNISDKQIEQIKKNIHNINFEKVAAYEKKFKHDVMAHIHALCDLIPEAKPILHLGATSAFVGDNTDIIQMREGMGLIRKRLLHVLQKCKDLIVKYKALPTLGYTHYQPAQLTTVGKRIAIWTQSLMFDLKESDFVLQQLQLRGIKGTTGTAASFKALFDGDFTKYKALDDGLATKMGFVSTFPVTGQTYDRKIDSYLMQWLSNIAQTTHKITTDIRLLAGMKQIEESFEKNQIGSSAMPYKRNPMKSERVGSLAKFVIALSSSTAWVASTQWLERSLDDSANKRLVIPQAMLATDAILMLMHNILDGLVVNEKVIEAHIAQELPFIITENIMMEAVKKGGDRQYIHEKIRKLSIETGNRIKLEGKSNDLLEKLAEDKAIPLQYQQLKALMKAEKYTGFAQQQCEFFIKNNLQPLLAQQEDYSSMDYEINV